MRVGGKFVMGMGNMSRPMGHHLPLGEIPRVFVYNKVRIDERVAIHLLFY